MIEIAMRKLLFMLPFIAITQSSFPQKIYTGANTKE